MTETAGEKRLALISEAADLILKGGGIATMAAIPATISFKASLLFMIIPLVVATLTLWVFAGFLFMLAAIRLEDVFLGGECAFRGDPPIDSDLIRPPVPI